MCVTCQPCANSQGWSYTWDSRSPGVTVTTGTPIVSMTISNDDAGYARLLAWIGPHRTADRRVDRGRPQLRCRTRPAVTAAGLMVIECEQPTARPDAERASSDPIDAHLAVVRHCVTTSSLPTPRADSDHEALRILLGARRDLSICHASRTNRLRAALGGVDTDRQHARAAPTDTTLAAHICRRRASRRQDVPKVGRRTSMKRCSQPAR